MTDLNDIVVFTSVVNEGSFTAAAKSLSLPKSTVSRRLSRLEDRLGTRLLQRTTRKLSLTDAGRAYYQRCSRIVADLDEADRVVADMQGAPRGHLRMTAPVELGVRLTTIVAEFLGRYSDVEVELDLTARLVDIVEEGYDLAIRAGHLADSSLVARRIVESPHGLYASPMYLEQHGTPVSIAELTDHHCVTVGPPGGKSHWKLTGPTGLTSVTVGGRFHVNLMAAAKEAAVAGLGIGLLPSVLCTSELDAGTLSEVLPEASPPSGHIWAVYPSTRHLSPKVRAFIDFLRERLGELLEV